MSEFTWQIREKAEVIISRLRTDNAFKAQVKDSPESILVAAGLPASVVTDVTALNPICNMSCTFVTGCLFTLN